MSGTVLSMDAWATPDLRIVELAIAIVCTRRPRTATDEIAAEITRWFGSDIKPAHVEVPLRRLVAREDVVADGDCYAATDKGRTRAKTAAQSLVRLFFRDRYFFDVGKLLDVTLVKEDHSHAQ